MLSQGEGDGEVEPELFQRADGEHEQLVEIIKSLLLDERKVFSVNIPNEGAVSGIPEDAVLEIPIKDMIVKRLASVDLTVEAALKGDRKLWADAMMLDGAVTDIETAEQLVEDFIQEHKDYLPQYR